MSLNSLVGIRFIGQAFTHRAQEIQFVDSLSQTEVKKVKADVDAFVGEADQFDDITMLGLHYFGQVPREEEPDAEVQA